MFLIGFRQRKDSARTCQAPILPRSGKNPDLRGGIFSPREQEKTPASRVKKERESFKKRALLFSKRALFFRRLALLFPEACAASFRDPPLPRENAGTATSQGERLVARTKSSRRFGVCPSAPFCIREGKHDRIPPEPTSASLGFPLRRAADTLNGVGTFTALRPAFRYSARRTAARRRPSGNGRGYGII